MIIPGTRLVACPDGPESTFGFGEPPVSEGAWEKPAH